MIIVGIKVRALCCTGIGNYEFCCFECSDIHEAATEVLKINRGMTYASYWTYSVVDGEFHDTETNKSWHVDAGGHTQRDYRRESSDTFKKRWEPRKEKL